MIKKYLTILISGLLYSSNLFAQSAKNETSSAVSQFIPIIVIFLVFYFLWIRPQQRKMKEHQNSLNNLKINDKIITSGGIYAIIKSIKNNENTLEAEIAENVIVKISKATITEVISKKNKNNKQISKINKKSKKKIS